MKLFIFSLKLKKKKKFKKLEQSVFLAIVPIDKWMINNYSFEIPSSQIKDYSSW